jgi:hypothetical protein
MSYRLHPLYRLAREVSQGEIDWDNPQLARLQQEMRIDYVEKMPTLDLITTVVHEQEAESWMMTLTEIMAQPDNQVRTGIPAFDNLDDHLGQSRN